MLRQSHIRIKSIGFGVQPQLKSCPITTSCVTLEKLLSEAFSPTQRGDLILNNIAELFG